MHVPARRRSALRDRLLASLVTTAMVSTLAVAVAPAPASADPVAPVSGVVGGTPRTGTPRFTGVSDGDDMIRAIEAQGDVHAAGGRFDTARRWGGVDQPVGNFSIWQDSTGALLPAPSFDNDVLAIEPAADGRSWYVGGRFKTVDGVARQALVRVGIDGVVDPTFTPQVRDVVKDMVLVGDRLYIGGGLRSVNGATRHGLAVLDATTGVELPWAPVLAGPYSTTTTPGSVSVDKLDASPDGSRLVIAGNFATLDGVATGRMAQFDITKPAPRLLDWSVAGLRIPKCPIVKTAQFITDLDVAPGGDYVVISTTGGWADPNGSMYLCDALTRFELDSRGSDIRPTWLSYSGGDSLTSVQIAGEVVYTGGHQRWMNNPYRRNAAGAGAVDRVGLSAHDARNGVPVTWAPVRNPRGFGAYELTLMDSGLWIGQDTGTVAGQYRGFAAHMPRQTGIPSLAWRGTGTLPVDVILRRDGAEDLVTFTGSRATNTGRTPTTFTGAVAMTGYGDDLLVATTSGELQRVTAGGTGEVTALDLRGLAPGYFNPANVRGLAYDEQRGELLYTLNGVDALYARGLSADGWLVSGTARVVATSANIDWRTTRSLFLVDGRLYVGRSDGTLGTVTYGSTGPADVVPTVVSSPALDGTDWSQPAGLRTSAATARSNAAPVAAFTMSCAGLSCAVDGAPSTDRFGAITSWRFTAQGPAGVATLEASHGMLTLPGPGPVAGTLTHPDDQGATASSSQTATLSTPPLSVVATADSNAFGTSHRVRVPSGTPEGAVAVLTASVARAGQLPATPTGLGPWTLVGVRGNGALESAVWWAPVRARDAGSTVAVNLRDTASKAHVSLTIVDGVHATAPFAAVASNAGSGTVAAHVSPTASTSTPTTVLELWAMRASDSTDWVPPSGTTSLTESHGVGSSHVSALLTARSSVAAGQVGGSTATADVVNKTVVAWTLALRSR